jgi:glycosyltransferase involved in cell wall biosynthesis
MHDAPGIKLIGHISTNIGLGVAARNTARLLKDRGDRFVIVDVATATVCPNADTTWRSFYHTGNTDYSQYAVNLFHFNPPEILAEARLRPHWLRNILCWNAIVPFYELTRLPDSWLPVIERMDTVMAPSRFIEEVVRHSIDHPNVIHFPQTVYLPDTVQTDRKRWTLRDDEVAFVFSFDVSSDPARKNPWAVIDAYRMARSELRGLRTRLLVKVNNPTTSFGRRQMAAVRAAAAEDPTIVIMDQPLSYADVLSLYASADIYVSLHRAEGLGLGLLESMLLGTPCIATGYSGNMDFMNEENSLLVDYTLVPVAGSEGGSYAPEKIGANQMWAEPSVEHAATQMVRLASDEELRARLGAAAQAAARATQTAPQRDRAIDHLLERAAAEPRPSRLHELEQGNPAYWRLRRHVGTRLRALGLR